MLIKPKIVFWNFTNHPQQSWSEKQKNIAINYNLSPFDDKREIIDIPFPQILPTFTKQEIENLALEKIKELKIMGLKAYDPIFIMGEMNFCYKMIQLLKLENTITLATTSVRKTKENKLEDGRIKRETIFEFYSFREY